MTAVLEWMARQTGPSDVLLSFDSRNGSERGRGPNMKAIGEIMENTRHVCTLWVVYGTTVREIRQLGFAWLSLPVPRTAIQTKERADVAKADKQRVMGEEPEQPPLKIWDRGMLYWQERVEFWKDILHCLDARTVIDMSPGSGAAGRACLRLGIQYTAACRTSAHASWLANVLDRESCEQIVTKQSHMFLQDQAVLIKRHFNDVLSQLQGQREATDPVLEEE